MGGTVHEHSIAHHDEIGARVVSAVVLAVVALTGCGGGSSSRPTSTSALQGWSTAACRHQSGLIADQALRLVDAYEPGSGAASVGDIAYFGFKGVFTSFEQHRCVPKLLGRALAHRLTRGQQRKLLSHLPGRMAAYVRSALAAGR